MFAIWIFTLSTGKYLPILCENELFIKICDAIDKNYIIDLIVRFITFCLGWIIICYAILQKKIFSYKPIIITCCVVVIWIIKTIFYKVEILNYLDFIIVIPLIIIKPKKWYRPIIGVSLVLLFTYISSFVKSISFDVETINNLPNCVLTIYPIDLYIMYIIYYIHELQKGGEEENGQQITVFWKTKIAQTKDFIRSAIGSFRGNCRRCCDYMHRSFRLTKDNLYHFYCYLLFFIIVYGTIVFIAIFQDRVIEVTISVLCFHLFRRKDSKSFHASNNIICWIVSILSFSVITLLSLDIRQSILMNICLAYILTTIMYYIKDYIDLKYMEKRIKKVKIDDLTYDEFCEMNNGVIENVYLKIVYDYIHRDKRFMNGDRFVMENHISKSTLHRLLQKVKANYEASFKEN